MMNYTDPTIHPTTLWTIFSGMLGGIFKGLFLTIPVLPSDWKSTVQGIFLVMVYAFISAVVGYLTKKLLDYFFERKENNN